MARFGGWRGTAILALTVVLGAAPVFAGDAKLNDSARILAGLEVDPASALVPLTKTKGFASHAEFFNKAWTRLDANQLSKVRAWSAENVKKTQPALFYMFSGPDFLYANAIFPKASTYVLAGLEPPGDIPDMASLPKPAVTEELRGLRASLNSVFSYSFFITKHMRRDLHSRRLTGTLPVLFAFLARSGKTIESVSMIGLDADGTVHALDNAASGESKYGSVGAKIVFSAPDGEQQTLYYFKTDLSNDGTGHSGFLKFCEGLGEGDALVKSASYLMHGDGFSRVRDFLLDHSAAIVQDDSGVPLKKFDLSQWQVEPFGSYVRPISLFHRNYQPDLHGFFVKRNPERLGFSFGYQWKAGKSMVLLAMKKTDSASYAANKPLAQPAGSSEVSRD